MADKDAIDRITLPRPDTGETARIAMRNGQIYCLEFDLGETTVAGSGKDVVLTFDDGSGVVLQNFFSASGTGDFYLRLPDGAVLSGRDMADTLAIPLERFHPGAGSACQSADHAPTCSAALLFPLRGKNAPCLEDILDAAMPPDLDSVPDELESLLPPSPAVSFPDNEGRPPDRTAAHPAPHAPAISADALDDVQEQLLLARLCML